MAEVFRPWYTTTDPKTGKRVKRRSKTWWVRYYLPNGERPKVNGYKDRKATEALAVELERKAAREAEGIFDPTDEQAKRPLAEHAAEFRRYLESKGNTADYCERMTFRLTAILDGCRFVRIGDLQPSAVLSFLAELRQRGKSLKTTNDYLAAVNSSCKIEGWA